MKGLLLASMALFAMIHAPIVSKAEIVGTARVIDGDTIVVGDLRIRLHGIDAPEIKQVCTRAGSTYRCGEFAARALTNMTEGRTLRCEQKDIDRYKRIIAVCRTAETDLNAWMVRGGYAVAYRYYSPDYVSLENAARSEGKGVWSGQFVMPWDWRRGTRLSSQGIRHSNNEKTPITKPKKYACCKICRKGQACGNSCISRRYTCRKPRGCACNQ